MDIKPTRCTITAIQLQIYLTALSPTPMFIRLLLHFFVMRKVLTLTRLRLVVDLIHTICIRAILLHTQVTEFN